MIHQLALPPLRLPEVLQPPILVLDSYLVLNVLQGLFAVDLGLLLVVLHLLQDSLCVVFLVDLLLRWHPVWIFEGVPRSCQRHWKAFFELLLFALIHLGKDRGLGRWVHFQVVVLLVADVEREAERRRLRVILRCNLIELDRWNLQTLPVIITAHLRVVPLLFLHSRQVIEDRQAFLEPCLGTCCFVLLVWLGLGLLLRLGMLVKLLLDYASTDK